MKKSEMEKDAIWNVYIEYALSGTKCFRFVGDKVMLMTLIGIFYSCSLEKIKRIDYTLYKEGMSICQEYVDYYISKEGRIYLRFHKEV